MKKLPFCRECRYYSGKGKCDHPKHGGKWPHIKGDFWCLDGEFKYGNTKE